MEPENNMQNNVLEEPKVEAASEDVIVKEIKPEESQPVVESEKMSKKSVIGLIVLTIIALAGVAFGVWGMMGKDQAEKDLAIKIKEANGTVTEIETDKIVSTDENGTVTEITDTNTTTSAVGPEDYIYVGEWGLKIKIPEGLNKVSYVFRHAEDSRMDTDSSLEVTGVLVDAYMLPDFAKLGECSGQGVIMRTGSDKEISNNAKLVYSDSEYKYWFSGSQSYCKQEAAEQEEEVRQKISNMLSNSENYSKI